MLYNVFAFNLNTEILFKRLRDLKLLQEYVMVGTERLY